MINTVTNNFEIKLPPTGLTYEHYPLMKERYQDYFSFWVFDRGEIDDLIYNYESYTPGNEMKLESTQNAKGTFTYQAANKMMQTYADRNPNLKFYGHTLTSHSQIPTWMRDAPPVITIAKQHWKIWKHISKMCLVITVLILLRPMLSMRRLVL